ncbi:CHRD domain-containing protein [Cystobacter fuscus]|uniref:CHRD domain-containing protein n=1 Tax=Cystobacter fuscus TaxID=43 RepID=UPI0037BE9ED5
MNMRYTMRQAVRMLVGVGLVGLVGCGGAPYVATAQLSGANEAPAVNTSATGVATAELDGSELKVTGTFSGLLSDLHEVSGSSVHIHQGAPSVAGGIVFGLQVTTGTDLRIGSFSGTRKLSSEEQEAFKAGQFYVNVHTVNNPGGEIRGQFVPRQQD